MSFLDLEAESDTRLIAFYADILEAWQFEKLPPNVRRRFRRIGIIEKRTIRKNNGLSLTPLGEKILEEVKK